MLFRNASLVETPPRIFRGIVVAIPVKVQAALMPNRVLRQEPARNRDIVAHSQHREIGVLRVALIAHAAREAERAQIPCVPAAILIPLVNPEGIVLRPSTCLTDGIGLRDLTAQTVLADGITLHRPTAIGHELEIVGELQLV